MTASEFAGFPPQALTFLQDLSQNNSKEWYEAHKGDYIRYVRDPAQAFVAELGSRVKEFLPDIVVDTRTNGSGNLMRFNRDTRFSKDKSPYKTNISFWYWQGAGKKMGLPGLGMQIEISGAGLATGMFGFDKPVLAAYQQSVASDKHGPELLAIVDKITTAGDYTINGEQYKRVPREYAADHPRAEWLKYKGLWASTPQIPWDVVTSPAFVDTCVQHFTVMAPLHHWIVGVTERVTE